MSTRPGRRRRREPRPDYARLPTEALHPAARNLELRPTDDIVSLLLREERRAQRGAYAARREIGRAVDLIVPALAAGGRLVYVGAGTSGRLAVLDAAELPPTFGTDSRQVQAIIAGGRRAVVRSVEGAEDREQHVTAKLDRLNVGPADVVCAIAASGVTTFARGALGHARRLGAATVFITCVEDSDHRHLADVVICAPVGPEVLAGSTRLKAGTATKMILNAISTTTMVKLGKVYRGRMVDVLGTNEKLRDRARRIVEEDTRLDSRAARRLLTRAGGSPKIAVAMHHLSASAASASRALAEVGGDLRRLFSTRPAPPQRPARRTRRRP